ncbi:MAG: hypothetical protein H6R18_2494, partial [Proteobacteria bacterium]|nr:hypothetical protein [Pseudomonadota bacterium]
ESAKVFQMQIATDPGQRRLVKYCCVRQALLKEMTGASQEGKGIEPHLAVFEREPLRIAPGVEFLDEDYGIRHGHIDYPRIYPTIRITGEAIALADVATSFLKAVSQVLHAGSFPAQHLFHSRLRATGGQHHSP